MLRLQDYKIKRSKALIILPLISGCRGDEVTPVKPPVVKIHQVSLSDTAQEENYSGVVKGRYETNLSFQVNRRKNKE